jgi:hypothetical protein
MSERRRVTTIRSGKPRSTPRRARRTVTQAEELGDHREILLALRRRLAEAADAAGPRDLAGLGRRLLEVDADLAAMDAAEEAGQVAAGGAAAQFDPTEL